MTEAEGERATRGGRQENREERARRVRVWEEKRWRNKKKTVVLSNKHWTSMANWEKKTVITDYFNLHSTMWIWEPILGVLILYHFLWLPFTFLPSCLLSSPESLPFLVSFSPPHPFPLPHLCLLYQKNRFSVKSSHQKRELTRFRQKEEKETKGKWRLVNKVDRSGERWREILESDTKLERQGLGSQTHIVLGRLK